MEAALAELAQAKSAVDNVDSYRADNMWDLTHHRRKVVAKLKIAEARVAAEARREECARASAAERPSAEVWAVVAVVKHARMVELYGEFEDCAIGRRDMDPGREKELQGLFDPPTAISADLD